MKIWDTVAVIGAGLIGGSVGLALLDRQLARRVIGIGRRPESLEQARRVGAVSEVTTDFARGVAEAELVVVCTPVERVVEHVQLALTHAPAEALVTDVGSTKQVIVEQISRMTDRPAAARFVGSHPLAGSEKTGAEFARADLFDGRTVIVTPSDLNRPEDVQAIEQFWSSLDARVVRMTPAEHDRAVASTSHVPHLAAAAIAAATPDEFLTLVASGWADTTRVAAGDAELWRQILSENRAHVLIALGQLQQQLASFQTALETDDQTTLLQLLEAGKQKRDSLAS